MLTLILKTQLATPALRPAKHSPNDHKPIVVD